MSFTQEEMNWAAAALFAQGRRQNRIGTKEQKGLKKLIDSFDKRSMITLNKLWQLSFADHWISWARLVLGNVANHQDVDGAKDIFRESEPDCELLSKMVRILVESGHLREVMTDGTGMPYRITLKGLAFYTALGDLLEPENESTESAAAWEEIRAKRRRKLYAMIS